MVKINLLPKNLRKRVEPGYWRIVAIAFPVLVLLICGLLQIAKNGEIANLTDQKASLETQKQALQRFVNGQKDLQTQQASLNEVVKIDAQLSGDPEKWSDQVKRFLERLPRKGSTPLVSLKTFNVKPVNPANTSSGEVPYDGKFVTKEIQLTGTASNDKDIIAFIQTFENTPDFGARFGRMQYNEQDGTYDFDASIGIVSAPPPPPPAVAPAPEVKP
jgi:type IV pilus assembly protein PilN